MAEKKEGDKKKGLSTLARLFGSKKKQSKKTAYSYTPHKGDPHASQITMSNDQILEIMVMVKEGKLSQAQALEQVKTHGVKKQELKQENGDHSTKDLESKSPGFLWFKPKDSPVRKPKDVKVHGQSDYEEPPNPESDTAKLLNNRLQLTNNTVKDERIVDRSFSAEGSPLPFHIFRKSSTDSNVSAPVGDFFQDKYSTQTSGHSWSRDTSAPNINIDLGLDSRSCGGSPRLRHECSDINSSSGGFFPQAGNFKSSQFAKELEENQNYEDLADDILFADDDDEMALNGKRTSVIDKIRKLSVSIPRRTSLTPSEGHGSADEDVVNEPERSSNNSSNESEKSKTGITLKGVGLFRKKKGGKVADEASSNSCTSDQSRGDSQKSEESTGVKLGSSVESMVSASSASHGSSCSYVSGCSSTDEDPLTNPGPLLAKARVTKNYTPSPYERGALTLRKGDIVQIINMDQSGTWKGIHKSKIGTFKFNIVEIIPEDEPLPKKPPAVKKIRPHKSRPKTLEELLKRIGLQELQCVLFLNGYSSLEDFSQIDEDTLNELHLTDPETRGKILTAAELLLDYDSQDSFDPCSGNRSDSKATPTGLSPSSSPAIIPSPELSPRTGSDSGCVDTEGLDESHDADSNSDTLKVSTESGDNLEPVVNEQEGDGGTPVIENCDIRPSEESVLKDMGGEETVAETEETVFSAEVVDSEDTSQTSVRRFSVRQIVQSLQQKQNSEMVGNGNISTSSSKSSLCSEGTKMSPKFSRGTVTVSKPIRKGPTPPPRKRTISVLSSSPRSPTASNILPVRSYSFEFEQASPPPEMRRKHETSLHSNLIQTEALVHLPQGNVQQDSATQTSDIQSPTDSLENGFPDSPGSSSSSSRSSREMRDASTQFSRRLANATACNDESDPPLHGVKVVKAQSRSQSLTRIVPSSPTVHSHIRRPSLTGVGCQAASPRRARHSSGPTLGTHGQHHTTLEQTIITKLEKEGIDLTEEPYTDCCGFCGIPAPLVQRYTEELRSSLTDVAESMENIRVQDVKASGKTAVPNDNLTETALNPVHEANADSISELMTSVGLPMYTSDLMEHGCKSVEIFRSMRDTDFKACGITDSSHIRKLVSVADLLRFRYESKLQTGKVSKVSIIQDKV